MDLITPREFAVRQPYFPQESETDGFYLQIANGLIQAMAKTAFGSTLSPALCKHLAMTLTGYLQDVVSDSGLWRSFIDANMQLYGYKVPFQPTLQDYVDYELNIQDIRFLVWYDIAMMDMSLRTLNPHTDALIEMADRLYEWLEVRYEDAPINEEYNIVRGLSLTDEADRQDIFHLANWLFRYSWLLSPAYALDLNELVCDPAVREDKDGIELQKRLDEAVVQDPTGPLALYIQEWVKLMITGRIDHDPEFHTDTEHPYYKKFVAATGGKRIAYFADYDDLNTFFINALGWEKGKRHLDQMDGEHDFVLLVNPDKGMLLAKNVAKCIADPDNALYDKDYATAHAIDLLTVRGLCPADLLKFIYEKQWLPDALFPGSDDRILVAQYHDFIARCYLQGYYRGD